MGFAIRAGVKTDQVTQMKIWEAWAKGYATITQVNATAGGMTGPIGYEVRNDGSLPVIIDEYVVLLSPSPVELIVDEAATTQDGALTFGIVNPWSSLTYIYGAIEGPEGEPEWWCTEDSQEVEAEREVALGGEILPYDLMAIVESNLTDPMIQEQIWAYMRYNPTLVVGKIPLWWEIPDDTIARIDMTIDVTNLGFQSAYDSIVTDTIPSGYSFDPNSFSPTPFSITWNADGSVTLKWIVSLGPASADADGDGQEREELENGLDDDLDGLIDEDTFDMPIDYQTVKIRYTLITPELEAARIFLPRAYVDTNPDGLNDAHSAEPLLEVYFVNDPPVPSAGGPYIANEGTPLTFDASASYDEDGDPLQYRWDFENDGIWDTPWSLNPRATHAWGDDFSGRVRVQVSDGVAVSEATSSVTIRNVPPQIVSIVMDQSLKEGETTNLLASFTDPGWLDTHSSTINWGDGILEVVPVAEENEAPDATGTFGGSHPYGDNGIFTVVISLVDDDGGTATREMQIDVSNLPPIIVNFTYIVYYNNPRTQGYWGFQCKYEEPPSEEHVGIKQEYIDSISNQSLVFNGIQSREVVCSILNEPENSIMLDKAKRQLMALWLNVVSGKLYRDSPVHLPNLTSSSTVRGAIEEIENVISTSTDLKELERAKDIADSINNGVGIDRAVADFNVLASDPGSDDLTFSWNFGDGSSSSTIYYNDGLGADPFPSPWGIYPFTARDEKIHAYSSSGTFLLILTVADDDFGFTSMSIQMTIP